MDERDFDTHSDSAFDSDSELSELRVASYFEVSS